MRLLLATSWGDLLKTFLANPLDFLQEHWYGLIFVLLLLFGLSRLNNYMEVNSVNRAINIARAFVGSVMAFIIAPITALMVINLVAYVKGIQMFSFWFILDWLQLTASSIWWIIKSATCFSCNNQSTEVAYDINSIIRIAWIVIPATFIWLRSTSSLISKLVLIPFVLAILYVTYQHEASPTFLDKYIPEKYKNFSIDDFLNLNKNTTTNIRDYVNIDDIKDRITPATDADRKPTTPRTTTTTKPRNRNIERKVSPQKVEENSPLDDRIDKIKGIGEEFKTEHEQHILLVLFGFLLIAAMLHFATKLKVLALIFLTLSIGGFLFMSPMFSEDTPPEPTYTITDRMLVEFEQIYQFNKGKASIELTDISIQINQRLKDEGRKLPQRYCNLYKDYFYDFCVE